MNYQDILDFIFGRKVLQKVASVEQPGVPTTPQSTDYLRQQIELQQQALARQQQPTLADLTQPKKPSMRLSDLTRSKK